MKSTEDSPNEGIASAVTSHTYTLTYMTFPGPRKSTLAFPNLTPLQAQRRERQKLALPQTCSGAWLPASPQRRSRAVCSPLGDCQSPGATSTETHLALRPTACQLPLQLPGPQGADS